MNTKVFILSFLLAAPIFIAVDYLAMHIHLIETRSLESEVIGAVFVSLFFAGVMTWFSNRKRKKQATNQ